MSEIIRSQSKKMSQKGAEAIQSSSKFLTGLKSRYPKRSIKTVSYVGMDTIEPIDEYDGITNIWRDDTKYIDPDYIYESDEDQDGYDNDYINDYNEDGEEFEDYNSDEEEDEYSVYSDEPDDVEDDEEDEEEEDFAVERVNERHIRFVYK